LFIDPTVKLATLIAGLLLCSSLFASVGAAAVLCG
jgi:hypothetical protein